MYTTAPSNMEPQIGVSASAYWGIYLPFSDWILNVNKIHANQTLLLC